MVGALTKYELMELPLRKPTGAEVSGAWLYLKAAHASVSGLFDALHLLRQQAAAARGERRGQLTGDQQDLLRAALVFTSSGLDACCQRLLRDSLPTLIEGSSAAEGKFIERIRSELTASRISKPLQNAICDGQPRLRLIDFYVNLLVGSSLQGTSDLQRVRDALGVAAEAVPDASIESLQSFFTARNRIVHELDYIEVDGRGARRTTQVMGDVRDQCNQVVDLLIKLLTHTAKAARAARKA